MKKTVIYQYEDVCLSKPEVVQSVTNKTVPLRIGYGAQHVGHCFAFRFDGDRLLCTVASEVDLKGMYPVLNAMVEHDVAEPYSLVVSREMVGVDENSEPFI